MVSDKEQLLDLMRALYQLTGIRFVLFNREFGEELSYPAEDCGFCRMMKCHPATRRKCRYADRRSFERCAWENRLVLYQCHAGLVEATMPLHENERIIGYLMFGQISDSSDRSDLLERLPQWIRYGMDEAALRREIDAVTYKPTAEIEAAAKIMEACTGYILYKELIRPQSNKLLERAKEYMEAHLAEDMDIAELCSVLGIGRTKLYEIFREGEGMGVSAYLLRRRMKRAKKLLKTTDLPITAIARETGFADYNYFSRVFKKTFGKSPRIYRK